MAGVVTRMMGLVLGALDGLDRRRVRNLLLLLGVATVVRLVVIVKTPNWQVTDSLIYHGQGLTIYQGVPDPRMPNGLPLLEAGLIALLGEEGSLYGVMTLNLLLSVASVWLIFRLGMGFGGPRVAWLSALLLLAYPHTLHFVRFELTETYALFFLLLGMVWMFEGKPLLGGIALGLLWLFRSSMLPVPLLLIGMQVFWPIAGGRLHGAARLAGGFALVWMLHWGLLQVHVVSPPNNLGENFIWAISGNSTDGIPFMRGTDPEETAHPLRSYLRFAAREPGTFLWQRVSSLWELCGPWPSPGSGDFRRSRVTQALIGLRFVLLVLALAATWQLRRRTTAYLWMPAIGVAVLHVVFFSEPRFWVPIEPLLMVLAAGVMALWLRRRSRSVVPKNSSLA